MITFYTKLNGYVTELCSCVDLFILFTQLSQVNYKSIHGQRYGTTRFLPWKILAVNKSIQIEPYV